MIRKPFAKILTLFMVCLSCAPAGKFSVSNVNEVNSIQNVSLMYALPLTVTDVTVYAEQTMIIPGPYRMYAKKYLGIEDAPSSSRELWNITGISIADHIEADPDFIYMVNTNQYSDFSAGFEHLMKDSLILYPGNFAYEKEISSIIPSYNKEVYYTDLSIKRNFEAEKKDVAVSQVMPDSGYIKQPSLKKGIHEKTLEEKAEEAADFIIKLRKRRAKMITAQSTVVPNGDAMGEAINEVNRLENEYVSLFIGKRVVNRFVRTYHFTPVAERESNQQVLFRFSQDAGFLDAMDVKGKPVLIDLSAQNKTSGLGKIKLPLKPLDNTLYYRIPDEGHIKILYGEELLSETDLRIFQFGVIVPFLLEPEGRKR